LQVAGKPVFGRALFELLQVSDDVGALMRIVDLEVHFGARHELARIGQPAVERGFVPGQTRILEGRGISIVLDGSSSTPDDAAMLRPQVVVVDGVASSAGLIERFAMHRVTFGRRLRQSEGGRDRRYEDGGHCGRRERDSLRCREFSSVGHGQEDSAGGGFIPSTCPNRRRARNQASQVASNEIND